VDELSPVSQLLKKARRRSLVDLVLDQAALAISIAMGGAIVLMVLGTSLLEWYWIAVLAIASLAVGLYRLRGRIPSEYRMAQRIDWKMNLADALSTATYFSSVEEGSPRREEICAQQRHSAEQIARATRLPIVYAAMRRVRRGFYAVEFIPLWDGRERSPPNSVTERYARACEIEVLKSPADWLWSYRRWRLKKPLYGAD